MRLPVVDQVFGANKPPIDVVLAADYADLVNEANALAERAKGLPKTVKGDDDLSLVGAVVADARELAKLAEGIRLEEGRPLLEATKSVNEFFKGMASRVSDALAPAQKAADIYVREKAAAERARREKEADDARKKEEAARAKAEAAPTAAAAANATRAAERHAIRAETAERSASSSNADLVRTRGGGVTSSARSFWTFRIVNYAAVTATLGPLGPFLPRPDVEKAIRSLVRIQKGGASLPGAEFYEDAKSSFRK